MVSRLFSNRRRRALSQLLHCQIFAAFSFPPRVPPVSENRASEREKLMQSKVTIKMHSVSNCAIRSFKLHLFAFQRFPFMHAADVFCTKSTKKLLSSQSQANFHIKRAHFSREIDIQLFVAQFLLLLHSLDFTFDCVRKESIG